MKWVAHFRLTSSIFFTTSSGLHRFNQIMCVFPQLLDSYQGLNQLGDFAEPSRLFGRYVNWLLTMWSLTTWTSREKAARGWRAESCAGKRCCSAHLLAWTDLSRAHILRLSDTFQWKDAAESTNLDRALHQTRPINFARFSSVGVPNKSSKKLLTHGSQTLVSI